MTGILVRSVDEISEHEQRVRAAAQKTWRALKSLMAHEDDGLQALQLMKFTELGHHPTEDRALNLLEQVNQTFTYLLSFQAARWVMDQHPEVTALQLSVGPHSGFDIQSLGSSRVAAEVFSATYVINNDKLKKDIRKLQKDALDYEHRYVFYSCPGHSDGRQVQREDDSGVEVWSISIDRLLKCAV